MQFENVSLAKDGDSSAEVDIQKPVKRKYQDDGASGSRYVSSWAAMKQYDDDHDKQWFEDENAQLGKDSPYLNVINFKIYWI